MARKQKIIKGCTTVALLLSLLLQAGCAFKDIDKRVFVVGVGIDPSDKVNDGFRVTLKLAKPIGNVKQATAPTYTYLSYDSDSVALAVQTMETRSDKVLDLGHNRIIIVNKDLLSKNLDTFLDFFTRRGDIQMISYLAAAEKTAEEIIRFEPDIENPASIALYNYFDNTGTESPYIVTTFLYQFRREILGRGVDNILPIMEIDEENNEYKVEKSIILKWKKEPLELTAEETKFFNSIENNESKLSFQVDEDDHVMVLTFPDVKMKYKIILDEGEPRIDMKITMTGFISESNQKLNIKDLSKYDKLAAKKIDKKVMELLTKLQENHFDPLGFGLRYRATRLSRKGIMDEWDRLYPEIQFNVKVDINLQSTGAVE